MQLYEHEAKALAAAAGIAVPRGGTAGNEEEAAAIARRLGGEVAVKAQIPTGGRGKAGGIKLVEASAALATARELLGALISGHVVRTVLVEERIEGDRELFLAITINPSLKSAVLLLSARGGVDVELGSRNHISSIPIPPRLGLRPWHVWRGARAASIETEAIAPLVRIAQGAYRIFDEQRAELVEINPLIVAEGGTLIASDVRVVLEASGDSASATSDSGEPVDPAITARNVLGFDFVTLNPSGRVGLITTGAGASMLVVDLLSEAGYPPINFCDLRTGRTDGLRERLEFVLNQLEATPRLGCLAVNVFAGVTELSGFAAVLSEVVRDRATSVPIIARIEGRGADTVREQLRGIGIYCVESLSDLASVVASVLSERPHRDTIARV